MARKATAAKPMAVAVIKIVVGSLHFMVIRTWLLILLLYPFASPKVTIVR
jgi:hypothetical protein